MTLLPRLSQILEFRFREKSHGRFHTRKVIKIKLFLLACSGDHRATVVPILRKATHTSCSPLHQSVLYRGQIYNCPCPEKHFQGVHKILEGGTVSKYPVLHSYAMHPELQYQSVQHVGFTREHVNAVLSSF